MIFEVLLGPRQDGPWSGFSTEVETSYWDVRVVSNMHASAGFHHDRCTKHYKIVQGNVHSITILTVRDIDSIGGLVMRHPYA